MEKLTESAPVCREAYTGPSIASNSFVSGPVEIEADVVSNLAWRRQQDTSRLAFVVKPENHSPSLVELSLRISDDGAVSVKDTRRRVIEDYPDGYCVHYVSEGDSDDGMFRVQP